jgi:formate hydrogenlyase transcriptional activator
MEKIGVFTSNEYNHFVASISLFDGDFSIDWILELVNNKASQVLSMIEEAVRQGCIIEKRPAVFCFTDSNEQIKWRNFLTEGQKTKLRQTIVDLLLSLIPEDDNAVVAVTPYLLHGTNIENCRQLLVIGKLHDKAFRHDVAMQCYIKILRDLQSIKGKEADFVFAETAIRYSKISTASHDTRKTISILRAALVRIKKWSEEPFQVLLKMHLAKNEWLMSKYRKAMKNFEQGWSKAKELNEPRLLRSVVTFSTFFLYWQGRFQEAVQNYEQSISDVEKYPQGRFPLLAALTMGRCYAQIGQINQGLGMLGSILSYSREKGDVYMETTAEVSIAAIMIEIRHIDDAIRYLEDSLKKARNKYKGYTLFIGRLLLAYAYYLKGDNARSKASLMEFLERSEQVKVTVWPNTYLMDLYLAVEQGRFPHIQGISLEREVLRMIKGGSILLRGAAYRYLAFLQKQGGMPVAKIINSLTLSVRLLEESGHKIELSRSQLELGSQYLLLGDADKAKELILVACKMLSSFNEVLVPDEFRSFIKGEYLGENLLRNILDLSKELVSIRDSKELFQKILTTANRVTGAERGAIFLSEADTKPLKLSLRASKNITPEQISQPSFALSMKMIKDVTIAGRGRIETTSLQDADLQPKGCKEIIRSRICVPMSIKDKVLGVLYHDNRLLPSAFKESDLEYLAYFAALAAFALDNATAYEEIKRLNQALREEKEYYQEQQLHSLHFGEIVGNSPAIKTAMTKVDQVAKTDTSVLIMGETGVGKEVIARAIHFHSSRSDKPFVVVHCNDLPSSLIASELFGHERGAFTGAINRRIGRFELANKGTIFLDEIGDIPLELQVRLLRILESKEFERVGGSETIHSDFRLVAATNSDIEKELETKSFRPDLYFRINVFPIYLPPLRERKEDIPPLTQYFLKIFATKMGKTFKGIPKTEMDKLIQYDWPGNVRELKNVVERATILSPEEHFQVPNLIAQHLQLNSSTAIATLKENERRHLTSVLQVTGWKVRGQGGAAELLDVHPSTLEFRMRKLGIQRPNDGRKKRMTQARLPEPGEDTRLLGYLK